MKKNLEFTPEEAYQKLQKREINDAKTILACGESRVSSSATAKPG